MLDLELIHFWTTHSVESFVDFDSCVTLFRTTLVELGLAHPFLMHEILALSSLHLSLVRPHKAAFYRHASDTHLATSLALLQPEMANLSTANCDACFAFSTTIFTHAWASQHPKKPSSLFFRIPDQDDDPDIVHVQWIKLHRGSRDIVIKLFPGLRTGPLEPLFAPWVGLDPDHVEPPPAIEEAQLTALSAAWHEAGTTVPEARVAVLDETLSTVRRVFSLLANNPQISKLSSVMAWFGMVSEDYLTLMEQKCPEALLVAVFYCVALKKAENMWWVRGKPENLLRTILAELGPGWERYTAWPVQQVLGNENVGRDFRIRGMLIDE